MRSRSPSHANHITLLIGAPLGRTVARCANNGRSRRSACEAGTTAAAVVVSVLIRWATTEGAGVIPFRWSANVHPLTLRTEEGEDLHALAAGRLDRVGSARVELRGLPAGEDQVLRADAQAQPTRQHVEPLVALVGLQGRQAGRGGRWDEDLVRLQAAGLLRQRDERPPVPVDGPGMDARVAGRRGSDQLVQLHTPRAGDREQQLQGRPPLAGLQARQRADRDPRGGRELGQRAAALVPDRP